MELRKFLLHKNTFANAVASGLSLSAVGNLKFAVSFAGSAAKYFCKLNQNIENINNIFSKKRNIYK